MDGARILSRWVSRLRIPSCTADMANTGDELYNYLTRSGPMEPSMVQRIFAQIVGAVSYVHNKSCVHRDLKLENILLDKHQNVKLADFGFTREYEGKANCLQTWCGTVCYSAPEMLKGEKYAGEKVDVWSLGIILYALLCGELPFDEDDENDTKAKILKEEPKYPDRVPQPARELISSMLSKRPLLRPALADILTNPWLSEHAHQQQAILKVQQAAPFTTQLEKDTLQRMRSAGVNIDLVIENVFSQRCDALAGWWALLLEKEERKVKRKERKRREKEIEAKVSRRVSGASARLDRVAPTIKETDEEGVVTGSASRGREPTRANGSISLDQVPEIKTPDRSTPVIAALHSSAARRPVRAASGSRRPQQMNTREYSKRNSGYSLVAPTPDIVNAAEAPKRKRRYQQPFMHQLASIKHWFNSTAKRAKSPGPTNDNGLLHPGSADGRPQDELHRVHTDMEINRRSVSAQRPEMTTRNTYPNRPRVLTNSSGGSGRRLSHSPSPLTPSSSYRRSGGSGLRGRKSTSSSVSSMRSIHGHHHSVSIASSSSSASASLASPSASGAVQTARSRRTSPNLSNLKAMPKAWPPSPGDARTGQLRLAPNPLLMGDTVSPFVGAGPPSPGLLFARRKRTPFKGPMLGPSASARRRSTGDPLRKDSIKSSRGRIIEEEEEEEGMGADEEDIESEEVDAFSPMESPVTGGHPFAEQEQGQEASPPASAAGPVPEASQSGQGSS